MKKCKYAIVHRGAAHRDEFMALGLAASAGLIDTTTKVFRRDPTDEELVDPDVLVLDVGRKHDPMRMNFDHHQFEKGVRECAFSLLAQFLRHNGGTYASLLSGAPWYRAVVTLDSCGPHVLAKDLGIERIPEELVSPVETGIIDSLSDQDTVPPTWLTAAKLAMDQKVKVAVEFKDASSWLREHARVVPVDGFQVLVAETKNTLGLAEFRKASGQDIAASITRDDRGPGWALYRFDDDPRVDFFLLKPLEGKELIFTHPGGFIAKTHEMDEKRALELVRMATVGI